MSAAALDKVLCTECNEVTLHRRNACIHCGTVSHASANKPVPRERPYGYATLKPENYNARAEQATARRRARAARAQAMKRPNQTAS